MKAKRKGGPLWLRSLRRVRRRGVTGKLREVQVAAGPRKFAPSEEEGRESEGNRKANKKKKM